MYNNYLEGDSLIIYILTDIGWFPVGCLTDNPFERTTGRIKTSARGSGGNESYLPTMHDYSLSFSGLLIKDEGAVSYKHLDILQDNRTIFEWRITSDDEYIDKQGSAFITSLSLGSSAGELVSFNCTLSPASGGVSNVLIWSQDGFNDVSQDGFNQVQINL